LTMLILHSGYAIGAADASNDEDRARSRVNSIQSEITTASNELNSLQRELHRLETTLREQESELRTLKRSNAEYEATKATAIRTTSKMEKLQTEVESSNDSAIDCHEQLKQLVSQMDQLSSLIDAQAVEAQNSATSLERFTGRNYQRAAQFRKHKAFIKNTATTLEGMQSRLPTLTVGQEMLFIDSKSWNGSVTVSTVELTAIPIIGEPDVQNEMPGGYPIGG
jgi:chromosome segregation ATPase